MAHTDSDLTLFSKRFEQVQQFEDQRTQFMTELFARYQIVLAERNQYQTILAERNREQAWMHHWPAEKQLYENYVREMQRTMFLEDFLRHGEKGGRQAAMKLQAAVKDHIQGHAENHLNDVPVESRVVCRIFANVRGLANVLVRTGIIPEAGQFEDFVHGFNSANGLYDFVDVGSGKDRADEKINGEDVLDITMEYTLISRPESFKLFSENPQCRRLLLGCSHDNGYARLLEKCSDQLRNKVILLEGVPFEKELVSLPYKTDKFPGIFRSTKLVVWGPGAVFSPFPQSSTTAGVIETKGILNDFATSTGFPSRFPAPTPTQRPSGSPLMDSPLPTRAMLSSMPRTPSTSTLASDSVPTIKRVPAPMNYAAKAAMPPPPAPASPLYKPANRDEIIARNRLGQRVDTPCKDYDKTEVDRVKRIKMCNVHFLRDECPYADNCTHLHAYQPTESELATLRLVARMAPCTHGGGCQDIKCIYGHRCPAPPGKNGSGKGTKSCIFGDTCKFAAELHDIDTTVVKTLVIR
ncbi:ccch zinc finger domain-containing protein [Stemphylium lycopersici]|uniref:Ccch zinc finger domain-containing protein n=1 Tax=Stemphylium lycopersici TaxID=183478 RepID=A0A364N238_STELY|nr:ccch zinc finger domain-containing protein [Stemphylium lycopersici]